MIKSFIITSCTAFIILPITLSIILGNTDVYFTSHSNHELFKDTILL